MNRVRALDWGEVTNPNMLAKHNIDTLQTIGNLDVWLPTVCRLYYGCLVGIRYLSPNCALTTRKNFLAGAN